MTNQPTPETDTRFIPPAARNLPLAALDSATSGADMLDAHATTPSGRNFLAHALVQLARDGWLRTEPGAGFESVDDDPAAPTPPQDGLHAPQDGPQHPDAGAEAPDGAGGRQTGAGGREPCRTTQHCAYHGWCHRCDPAFAAVMSRVNVAIQRNDPNDSHWGALYEAVGQALRGHAPTPRSDMGTEFVHQVDHPDEAGLAAWEADLASGDAADGTLREQYAAAIHADAERPRDERVGIINAVLAVRDEQLEELADRHRRLGIELEHWQTVITHELRTERDQLAATLIRDQAALAQIRLHIAAHRPRLQYADPILLGQLDAVLRQVGELEAAGGGEQA